MSIVGWGDAVHVVKPGMCFGWTGCVTDISNIAADRCLVTFRLKGRYAMAKWFDQSDLQGTWMRGGGY